MSVVCCQRWVRSQTPSVSPDVLICAMSRQTAVKMSSLLAESFSCNVCFSLEIRSQSHGQESGGYHNTIHPQRCSLCFPTLPHFGAKKVSTTYGVTRVCCFVAPDKCITIWHSCVPCLKMATFVCAMPEDDGNGHNMFYSQVSACIRLCCQSKYTFTCG